MSLEYLLLPRLQVQAANAQATWWLINAAPVVAATLFAHNLGRQTKRFPVGVGIIHHSAQLLGEQFWSYGKLQLHPQQRRGAIFIDNQDYIKPRGGEKRHPTLSMQPSATCHLTWSLLLAYAAAEGSPSVNKVDQFLSHARLAGGQIISHAKPKPLGSLEEVRKAVRSGYWLVERQDLMEEGEGDPLDRLIHATTQRKHAVHEPQPTHDEGENPSDTTRDSSAWIVPATLGYAPITEFAQREGVREGYPHAYAEPLVGLVQYVSVHHYETPALPLWRQAWLDHDVFIVTQQEL